MINTSLLLLVLFFSSTNSSIIFCSEDETSISASEDDDRRFDTITREHENEAINLFTSDPYGANSQEIGFLDDDKTYSENFKHALVDLKNHAYKNQKQIEKYTQRIKNCLSIDRYYHKLHKEKLQQKPTSPLLVDQLIEYGEDKHSPYKPFVQGKNYLFYTPLAIACDIGHTYMVKQFLDAKANPNKRSMNAHDYFLIKHLIDNKMISIEGIAEIDAHYYPAIQSQLEASKSLHIKKFKDEGVWFSQQDAPLHIVCESDIYGTHDYYRAIGNIKLLLQKRANVNLQGKNGDTPLHRAAKSNFYKFKENKTFAIQATTMLLAAKASPLVRNDDGDSAIDLARKTNKPEVVRLLNDSLKMKPQKLDEFAQKLETHLKLKAQRIKMIQELAPKPTNPNKYKGQFNRVVSEIKRSKE